MAAGAESSGSSTVYSVLAMGILASLAIVLRYLAKIETKVGLAADDYWIAVSLATYWAYAGVLMWCIFAGGGGLDTHKFVEGNKASVEIFFQVANSKIQESEVD